MPFAKLEAEINKLTAELKGVKEKLDQTQKQIADINALATGGSFIPEDLQAIVPRSIFEPWKVADCSPPYDEVNKEYKKLYNLIERLEQKENILHQDVTVSKRLLTIEMEERREKTLAEKAKATAQLHITQLWNMESGDIPEMAVRTFAGAGEMIKGREHVKDDIMKCLNGILDPQGTMWAKDGSKPCKSKMIALHGIKGEGKTLTLQAIVGGPDKPGWAEEANGGKAVMVTYNEDSRVVELTKGASERTRLFAAQMLSYNGMDFERALQVASLDDAVILIRRSLGLEDGKPLTVCVDELVKLVVLHEQGNLVKLLISELLQYQDESIAKAIFQNKLGGPVIFVFTSLTSGFMSELVETGSGRVIHRIPLCNLPHDVALMLVENEDLRHLIANDKGVKQLFSACLGHPRAIVDGFCKCDLTTHHEDADLVRARVTILQSCKIELDAIGFVKRLDNIIPIWFSPARATGADDMEWMRTCGVLQSTVKNGTTIEVMSPLVLQWWSSCHKVKMPLAYHLFECYSADELLNDTSPTVFESVTYHFEAVLKCALGADDSCPLNWFFRGSSTGSIGNKAVTVKTPTNYLVKTSDSFTDCVALLEQGYTVVSTSPSEGIEYMSPFFIPDDARQNMCQNQWGVLCGGRNG